jgi:1-acyl-sn-glycerol-3-phosphate acyltransferase
VRQLLDEGWNLIVYPEGTRTPDGRLYRGKTGMARIALDGHFPVLPVGVLGTFEAFPADRKLPRRGQVEVRFGKPLRFDRYNDRPADQFLLRSVTDEIMYEIMMLTNHEYVDEYATRLKEQPSMRGAAPAGERELSVGGPERRAGDR